MQLVALAALSLQLVALLELEDAAAGSAAGFPVLAFVEALPDLQLVALAALSLQLVALAAPEFFLSSAESVRLITCRNLQGPGMPME